MIISNIPKPHNSKRTKFFGMQVCGKYCCKHGQECKDGSCVDAAPQCKYDEKVWYNCRQA